MIIGCPSCHTKFSVDGQQLAAVENPRFHCSRCGHVFELSAADRSDKPAEPRADSAEAPSVGISEETTPVSRAPELPQGSRPAPEGFSVGVGSDVPPAETSPAETSPKRPTSTLIGEAVTPRAPDLLAELDRGIDQNVEQLDLLGNSADANPERMSITSRLSEGKISSDSDSSDESLGGATASWPGADVSDAGFGETGRSSETGRGEPGALDAETEEFVAAEILDDEHDAASLGKADWSANANAAEAYVVKGPNEVDIEAEAIDVDVPKVESAGDMDTAGDPVSLRNKGTMKTWINPVLPGASDSLAAERVDPPESPADSREKFDELDTADDATRLRNLFGVEWEAGQPPDPQEVSLVSDTEMDDQDIEASGQFHAEDLSAEDFGEDDFDSRPHFPEESSAIAEDTAAPELGGGSMRKTFTEVMPLPPSDEPKEHIKKVIDLHDAPSIEREKVKKKALKRAAQHERILGDSDAVSAGILGQAPRGWWALGFVWSVPFVLSALFLLWSMQVEAAPGFLLSLFHMDSTELPKAPPPGLALIDLSSEVISLDDGTKVIEIEGTIFNATVETFQNVRLKAKTYDEANTQLRELTIRFNNGLVNARLEALSENAIDSLQKKVGVNLAELKPNVKAPFRIVVTGLEGSEKWFSARVLSVDTA